MDVTLVAVVLLAVMTALLASGLWLAMSLLAVGLFGLIAFTSVPAGKVIATTMWGGSDSWALTALPLFVWMAEILFRTRLSDDIFSGLAPWLTRIPGRLIHVNIVGCGVFSAVSGSNAATCATIAKIAMPELMRRGYDERMVIGTLTASGTLGILIPPSIMMIVYGFIAQVSIARLFIAGFIPGFLIMALFMGYVIVWAWRHPEKTPPARHGDDARREALRVPPADPGDGAHRPRHGHDLLRHRDADRGRHRGRGRRPRPCRRSTAHSPGPGSSTAWCSRCAPPA